MQFRLPEPVVEALTAAGPDARGMRDRRLVTIAVARLADLPVRGIVRAGHEIHWLAGLYHEYDASPRSFLRLPFLTGDRSPLGSIPGLEYLFLFHRNGHLRQAALERLNGPIESPFFVAALALRLNDWAAPVRAAAVGAAERCLPSTPTSALADAASFLIGHSVRWQRWGEDERRPLEHAFARADVVSMIVQRLCDARTGPIGALLRSALRGADYDAHLGTLATKAALPDVRAIALATLIKRRAEWWGSQRQKRWIDKSMGRFTYDYPIDRRAITSCVSPESALAWAARDRCARVRRVAVVALLTPNLHFANFDEITGLLSADRNRALRERAVYARDIKRGAATGD